MILTDRTLRLLLHHIRESQRLSLYTTTIKGIPNTKIEDVVKSLEKVLDKHEEKLKGTNDDRPRITDVSESD